MSDHYQKAGPSVNFHDLRIQGDYAPISGDVAFYLREARKTGGPILELACGTGRIAIPLARAGFEIVGLDKSPLMLRIARGKATGLRKLLFCKGDMERFDLGRRFRLILIPFRSFQHLLTPDAQRSCLSGVRKHLTRDGRFIVQLFDPRLDHFLPEEHRSMNLRPTLRDAATGRRWTVKFRGRINDPLTQTLQETWEWTAHDARRRVVGRFSDRLRLRWTYRFEMRYLLELCGFEPIACFSNFRRGRPRYGAEQIWVARRA